MSFQAEIVDESDAPLLFRADGRLRDEVRQAVLRTCVESPVQGRQKSVYDVHLGVGFETLIEEACLGLSGILVADLCDARSEDSVVVRPDLTESQKKYVCVMHPAHRKISSNR